MLKTLSKLVAGATLLAVVPFAAAQGKLTILWAQWDPANGLESVCSMHVSLVRRPGPRPAPCSWSNRTWL